MINVAPIMTVLEIIVGMPKISIKSQRRKMLSTEIKIPIQV